jgi:hypothetical protein
MAGNVTGCSIMYPAALNVARSLPWHYPSRVQTRNPLRLQAGHRGGVYLCCAGAHWRPALLQLLRQSWFTNAKSLPIMRFSLRWSTGQCPPQRFRQGLRRKQRLHVQCLGPRRKPKPAGPQRQMRKLRRGKWPLRMHPQPLRRPRVRGTRLSLISCRDQRASKFRHRHYLASLNRRLALIRT